MKIYETPEGVNQYFEMSDGYDLSHYQITGSDYSMEFISRAQIRFPGTELMLLDGVTLETDVYTEFEENDSLFVIARKK